MNTDFMNWLNMVWSALDEQDSEKRVDLLDNANSFLEQVREQSMAGDLSTASLAS